MRAVEDLMVLVDDDDCVIGTAGKRDTHRQGALHRAFSIIVWDSAGRLLLQERHKGKYHSGGLWTNACCGHPRPGEDIAASALRRLARRWASPARLPGSDRSAIAPSSIQGAIEHEIVHVFRGLYDGEVAPNPAEAEGYQWASLDDVRADVAAMPLRFSVWFRAYIAAQWPMALALPGARPSRSPG